MLSFTGSHYRITEIFEDKEERHIQVRDNYDWAQTRKLLNDYERIGLDYMRDDEGKIKYDNGFHMYGKNALGTTWVSVAYIGSWEEI